MDPPGSAPVVIVNAGASIVIAKLRVAVIEELSVTVAVKLKLPADEGTPLITPPVESVSPAGAEPDQRYGGTPPDAARGCEYGVPSAPRGSGEVVVIVSGAGLIVILKLRLAVRDVSSVTVAVKVKLPAAVGVPVSEPLEASESPAGAEPDH